MSRLHTSVFTSYSAASPTVLDGTGMKCGRNERGRGTSQAIIGRSHSRCHERLACRAAGESDHHAGPESSLSGRFSGASLPGSTTGVGVALAVPEMEKLAAVINWDNPALVILSGS